MSEREHFHRVVLYMQLQSLVKQMESPSLHFMPCLDTEQERCKESNEEMLKLALYLSLICNYVLIFKIIWLFSV